MRIRIFYDNIKFRLKNSRKVTSLIEKVIGENNYITGDLSFIITTDKQLVKINREFLQHNYYTDVIAFGYNEENTLNGEIYISLETVRRNADNYKISLANEILRVMIHGTLHLCGYEDDSIKKKERMRFLEDKWIEKGLKEYGIQI